MSQVIWCDYGDHAAKLTEDTIHMTQQAQKQIVGRDSMGRSIVDTVAGQAIDICRECGVLAGIIKDYTAEDPDARHKAIEAAAGMDKK